MSIARKARAFVGLAVVTASLFACAPGDPSNEAVTAANANDEASRVASSSLSQNDKDAFAAFIAAHAKSPGAYDGKTVRQIINLQLAFLNGQKMAADEKRDQVLHREEIARLMSATVLRGSENGELELDVTIANKTSKTVRRVEMGLYVNDAKHQVGMCELALDRDIAPHSTLHETIPVHYSQFGEDTTSVMHAAGKPKRYALDIKEIKYTDGSDAGYDD